MVTKKEIKDFTEEEVNEAAKKVVRISPSKRRVFEMSDELLLNNYALIAHKASSLSSSQRKLVIQRVGYRIQKSESFVEKVTEAVNKLSAVIEMHLREEFKRSKTIQNENISEAGPQTTNEISSVGEESKG